MARRLATASIYMPGGQKRLRQVILYVAAQCEGARFFGAVKLNKIIWKADFDSFAERQVPITGREYRRQKFGPALREMLPVQRDMEQEGAIRFELRDYGGDIIEKRTVAIEKPDLSAFSSSDIAYIDRSIAHYWDMTGAETSDESHGVAWRTRTNGDPMPYQLAILSDRRPAAPQWERLKCLIRSRELTTE